MTDDFEEWKAAAPSRGAERWATFTTDELAELVGDFDPELGIGARIAHRVTVTAEIVAEINRRKDQP
jgi:hypothetical protein